MVRLLLAWLLALSAGAAAEPLWTSLPAVAEVRGSCADFSRLVAAARPAVVTVVTEGTGAGSGSDEEPYWPLLPDSTPAPVQGLGTGFVIRADGYIVTSNHVVAGAGSIRVRTLGGQQFAARLVGGDERSDIALLKVATTEPLPVLPLGDSDRLRVGQWVVAIGNPHGLQAVATKGIVSGMGRSLEDLPAFRGGFLDFIQTDASLDAGSSGGPLLNLRGEVVGIASAINARARGIGFAVPVNLAKAVLPALARYGHLERAYLGIRVDRVDWQQARLNGLAEPRGVLVTSVVKGGPAERAGLQAGDLLIRLQGHEVRGVADVGWRVSTLPLDAPAQVSVLRQGKRLELAVRAIARSSRFKSAKPNRLPAAQSLPGIEVAVVAGDSGAGGRLPVVVAVRGEAARRGVRLGDIIVALDDKPVNSVAELRQRLEKTAPGTPVRLYLQRRSQKLYVALTRK